MFDPSKPPLVEETLLKNRRSLDELAQRRSLQLKSEVKRKRVVRGEDVRIKRPEQFVRENLIKAGSQQKMERRKRMAEKRTTLDIPKGSLKKTVGFVVRIHVGKHSSPEIKQALQEMGLNKKYDAVFVNLNEAMIRKLKAYDAYVAYGYLTKDSVEELLQRRAFTNAVSGVKRTLSDNLTVEEVLGEKCNIICVGDLVHEIYNVGEHFDQARNVLCTFELAAPVGGFERKVLQIHEEIEQKGGFIGLKMEDLLRKIL